mmetsp:Transcript_7255/g.18093  ORF Transcript_7255/g.18093 Transcript_7255/m.18093 type:complete len:246 (+) Transcript_7255:268-1005(+)
MRLVVAMDSVAGQLGGQGIFSRSGGARTPRTILPEMAWLPGKTPRTRGLMCWVLTQQVVASSAASSRALRGLAGHMEHRRGILPVETCSLTFPEGSTRLAASTSPCWARMTVGPCWRAWMPRCPPAQQHLTPSLCPHRGRCRCCMRHRGRRRESPLVPTLRWPRQHRARLISLAVFALLRAVLATAAALLNMPTLPRAARARQRQGLLPRLAAAVAPLVRGAAPSHESPRCFLCWLHEPWPQADG